MLHQQFVTFLEELSRNNNKEWFDLNRKTYIKEVKEPFKKLVEQMIEYVSADNPDIVLEAKNAIFRINRDIRFSKDKTPYKTHLGAAIAQGGKKSVQPGFYVHLSYDKMQLGGGAYNLDKEALKKVRSEIMYEEAAFLKAINDKNFIAHYGTIKGAKNKILPADFKEAAKEQPLLFNKQFYYMTDLSVKNITAPNLLDLMIEYYEAGKKFNQFIAKAIGND